VDPKVKKGQVLRKGVKQKNTKEGGPFFFFCPSLCRRKKGTITNPSYSAC
jgi:hypothetical protein